MNWFITDNTSGAVALNEIPEVGYNDFYNDLAAKLSDPRYHAAHYFALPWDDRLRFICLICSARRTSRRLSSISIL